MKKTLKIIMCSIILLSLCGCSLFNKDTNNTENSTIINNDENTTNTTSYTLEDFVEENRSSIMAFENELLTSDLVARDKSLVYIFKYKTTYSSSDLPAMKNSLDTSIANQRDTYMSVLNSLRTILPDTKSVIIEYYNGDNTLISKTEFN